MLTRAQIQRLAQRHKIGVQAQERDYALSITAGVIRKIWISTGL